MNAIIKVTGNLSFDEGMKIIQQLLTAMKNKDVENIVFFIASDGGCPDIIRPIWELVQMSSKKIISIGTISVSSTAAAIFMMGHTRILLPNTTFVLHKSTIHLEDDFTVDDLKNISEEAKECDELLWLPVIENSKITKAMLNKKCNNCDWYLSKKEITSYEIVTEEYNRSLVQQMLL